MAGKDRWRQTLLVVIACLLWCGLASPALALAPHAKSKVVRPPAKAQAKAGTKAGASTSAVSLYRGGKIFCWQVSGPNAVVYLVGTLHMVRPDFYPLPRQIEQALSVCPSLAVEVDESQVNPNVLREFIVERGQYTGDDNIYKHLSPQTAKALKEYAAEWGMTAMGGNNYTRFKPWMLALQIAVEELSRQGFDAKLGVDKHLIHEAQQKGKEVIGLETMEFQMNLFADFSDDLQDQMLFRMLLDMKESRQDADAMMRAWKEGNARVMDFIISKDTREHPELLPVQEKIIYERNVTMSARVDEFLKNGRSCVVAVGSGHLVGERGIVSLLEKKGYKVEQVSAQATIAPPPPAAAMPQ